MNQRIIGNITYTPTRVSSLVPLVFLGVGVLFVVVGLLFTLVLLFVVPPVALITLLFSFFGVAFVALGGWRWYANRQQRLQLTPQALVSFTRGKRFQLPLAEISGISGRIMIGRCPREAGRDKNGDDDADDSASPCIARDDPPQRRGRERE